MANILIIDDELDIRDMLSGIFEDENYNALKAAHSEQALSIIQNNDVDLIVLDIWLDNSDMDGIQILKHLKASEYADIPILMISGHGNVEMAVNAMKMGAFDFIEKPFKIDHILLTAERALEQRQLKVENKRLKQTESNFEGSEIVHSYQSSAMKNLYKQLQDNAELDSRVLIVGEKGSGKTRIANLIHENSSRRLKQCIIVRALDITDVQYLNDQLALAKDGTFIIEDVENSSPEIQAEILSIINQKLYPCRIISTMESRGDKFSSSLYDRLSVILYQIPSLKDREDDIVVLITEFIKSICNEYNEPQISFSQDIINALKKYEWIGNIRQLKIAVEWIAVLSLNSNKSIGVDDIAFLKNCDENIIIHPSQKMDLKRNYLDSFSNMTLKQARDEFEKQYLQNALNSYEGNIARVAQFVDMERTALYRKLKSLDVTYNVSDNALKAKQS